MCGQILLLFFHNNLRGKLCILPFEINFGPACIGYLSSPSKSNALCHLLIPAFIFSQFRSKHIPSFHPPLTAFLRSPSFLLF